MFNNNIYQPRQIIIKVKGTNTENVDIRPSISAYNEI